MPPISTIGLFTFGVRLEDNGLMEEYFFDVRVDPNNAPSIAGLIDPTVSAGGSA